MTKRQLNWMYVAYNLSWLMPFIVWVYTGSNSSSWMVLATLELGLIYGWAQLRYNRTESRAAAVEKALTGCRHPNLAYPLNYVGKKYPYCIDCGAFIDGQEERP